MNLKKIGGFLIVSSLILISIGLAFFVLYLDIFFEHINSSEGDTYYGSKTLLNLKALGLLTIYLLFSISIGLYWRGIKSNNIS